MESELTIFADLLSQPSRAVIIFCKLNGINYTLHTVSIAKGEQKSPEFLKVNPIGQVPAIKDGDFSLGESHAIVRYLAESRNINNHWFPNDPKKRARVNQYLDWHLGILRQGAMKTVFLRLIAPILGNPVNPRDVEVAGETLVASLNTMEKGLSHHKYIMSEEISFADISAASEVAQLKLIEYDLSPYPNVQKWLEEILEIKEVKETFEYFYQMKEQFKKTSEAKK